MVDLRARRRSRALDGREGGDADWLLRRVARGEVAAFDAFYDLVVARVHGTVRSVVRDPAQSEEVTQEVMVELWRTAPNFDRSRGSATGWAVAVAHRRAVDRVRSSEAARRRDDRHGRLADVAPSPVEEAVVLGADRAAVAAALAELTDQQRESIELAFYRGLSHTEVAALLDLPLGTVKTRIRDGMIRLRDRLGALP